VLCCHCALLTQTLPSGSGKLSSVAAATFSLHILLIQSWTSDVRAFEETLRAAGIEAAITRVDFRAALEAALARQRFDLVVLDPSTSDLPRVAIEECLQRAGHEVSIILLEDMATLGERVLRALAPRLN